MKLTMSTVNSELEEIARISRESQSIARDKRFLRLSKMRKGESIVVKMTGGWGKVVRPTFGDDSKEEGDEVFFQYEFEIIEGIEEIEAGPTTMIFDAPRTYFKRLDPMMRMGHRMFKITRVHSKGERDKQGNIITAPNYEILSMDKADPALAIA